MTRALNRRLPLPAASWVALTTILVLSGLVWIKDQGYLLFHSLAELFSITIATSAFVIAWNSRRFREDSHLTFLGLGLLSVAAVELIHTLAYPGMGVFKDLGTNTATELWIASRYLEAGVLLALPLLVGRRVRSGVLLAGFGCW